MMFANARNPALFFRTRPSHARPGSSVREAISNSCPNNTIEVPGERRLIPVMRWSTLAHARSAATIATSGTAALERIRNRQCVWCDCNSGIRQLTFEEKPGKRAVPSARVDEKNRRTVVHGRD